MELCAALDPSVCIRVTEWFTSANVHLTELYATSYSDLWDQTYGSTSSSSGSQFPAAPGCVACSPLLARSRRYRPVEMAAKQLDLST